MFLQEKPGGTGQRGIRTGQDLRIFPPADQGAVFDQPGSTQMKPAFDSGKAVVVTDFGAIAEMTAE